MASVFGIAIGANGTTLLAVEPYQRPKISTNGGSSWSDVTYFSGTEVLIACAIGSDNQTMLIADPDAGILYLSLNAGVGWSTVTGPLEGAWPGISGVGIAADNQTMVACCYDGRCYITHNRWSSITEIRPIGDEDGGWHSIAISANGLIILAGMDFGRLYLSQDGGTTENWPEVRPKGDDDWQWWGVAVAADNENLMACDYLGGGTLFRSSSIGASWFEEVIDDDYPSFSAVAFGGEDLHVVAACDEGYGTSHVYIGAYTPPPEPEPGPDPGPPDFPVIDKFRLDAYYAILDIEEVEILALPTISDFIDLNT